MADDIDIDYGDETLNDPNYEANIEAAENATDDTVTQGVADETVDNTQQGSAPAKEDAPKVADTVEGGDGDKQGSGGKQDDDKQSGATKSDDKGNLVDKDGKIIAAAGAERRHFETAQRQARYITRLEAELNEARQGTDMAQVLNGAPQALGLDAEQTQMGLQIVASFKKDPVATARWALQETMRMGYNLQQIVGEDAQGQVNGGSMDLQAVRSMINEAVNPLVSDRAQAVEQQRVQQAAQREYDAFVAKHEHAEAQQDTLAQMLQRDPALTPETAYWQLIAYCARNNFDPTIPLREQVQSRQQGAQPAPNGNAQPSSAQTQGQRPPQQPMPNGASPVADMQTNPDMADPEDSWDRIVNASLRNAGFN